MPPICSRRARVLRRTALCTVSARAERTRQSRTLGKRVFEACSDLPHVCFLQAVTQLAAHFESYRDIPKIAEVRPPPSRLARAQAPGRALPGGKPARLSSASALPPAPPPHASPPPHLPTSAAQVRGKFANIKLQLRELVFNEFSRFGREGSDDAASFRRGELSDACLVVEALEPHVKEELVGSLCNREITAYMQIFSATQGEASHLDKVERRYAYIKQKIKQREDAWSIFPVSWRVPQLITLALCKARERPPPPPPPSAQRQPGAERVTPGDTADSSRLTPLLSPVPPPPHSRADHPHAGPRDARRAAPRRARGPAGAPPHARL